MDEDNEDPSDEIKGLSASGSRVRLVVFASRIVHPRYDAFECCHSSTKNVGG